ncbi:class I SAM-dependent methyltransferase [Silvimonas sp. JCM 19000]
MHRAVHFSLPLPSPHDHWREHAAQWQQIAAPLRPGPEDIALMRTGLDVDPAANRGLLLGMTQELWGLGDMTGVDRDPAMVQRRRAQAGSNGQEVQADWRDLPFSPARFDFAVGDGALNNVDYSDEYRLVLSQLTRVLRPRGRVALRVFVRPEAAESMRDVFTAARAGAIGSFHAFKWRLAMALCSAQGDANIAVADIHHYFAEHAPDRDELAARAGWPRPVLDTIDVYAQSTLVYSFPTLAEVRACYDQGWQEISVAHGQYELAERCPVLVLQKRI